MKVRDCGKYLGFVIGPGAADQDWERVMPFFSEMSRKICSLSLPKKASIMLYHMLALSKTQFIAQLRKPNKDAIKQELVAVKRLIGGPNNWVTPADLRMLCNELEIPFAVKSLEIMSQAAMLRTGLVTAVGWKQTHAQVVMDLDADECFLSHSLRYWIPKTSSFLLDEAISGFNEGEWNRE
jgi:hypothetical protein